MKMKLFLEAEVILNPLYKKGSLKNKALIELFLMKNKINSKFKCSSLVCSSIDEHRDNKNLAVFTTECNSLLHLCGDFQRVVNISKSNNFL